MNVSIRTKIFLIILITLSVSLVPISALKFALAHFDHNVTGWFRFIWNGEYMKIVIKIEKGLEYGQQYPYHVHVAPVGEGHNCTATLGHLDPFGNYN